MGPTVVTPRTHTRFRERQQAVERLEAVEAVRIHEQGGREDGSLAALRATGNEYAKVALRREQEHAEECATARELEQFGEPSAPVPLLLGVGDVGVMDTRLIHFGSAYPSLPRAPPGGRPRPHGRVLLNATFAAEGPRSRIHGFTYHRRADARPRTIASILEDTLEE